MNALEYYVKIFSDRQATGELSLNDVARFLKPILAYAIELGHLPETDQRERRLDGTPEMNDMRRWEAKDDRRRLRETV